MRLQQAIGAIIDIIVLIIFAQLSNWVNLILNGCKEMYIAQAHFIYNIASTILSFYLLDTEYLYLKKLFQVVITIILKLRILMFL